LSRGARHKKRQEDEGVEGPLRRCIATGETHAPEEMVRFVVAPSGMVVPDVAHKLPGRGMWVTASREAVARAAGKGLFAKAAKAPVSIPATLADDVETLLVKRLQDHLGLAKRAGVLIVGYQKVEEAFQTRKTKIEVLVEAADSGAADRGKLINWARKCGDISIIGCLTAEEIGLALGRESVVHAALTSHPLAARTLAEAKRLGGFRVLCPHEWGAAMPQARSAGDAGEPVLSDESSGRRINERHD
jgi:predicted RNA-binding protein YlxR (DUF448 family)